MRGDSTTATVATVSAASRRRACCGTCGPGPSRVGGGAGARAATIAFRSGSAHRRPLGADRLQLRRRGSSGRGAGGRRQQARQLPEDVLDGAMRRRSISAASRLLAVRSSGEPPTSDLIRSHPPRRGRPSAASRAVSRWRWMPSARISHSGEVPAERVANASARLSISATRVSACSRQDDAVGPPNARCPMPLRARGTLTAASVMPPQRQGVPREIRHRQPSDMLSAAVPGIAGHSE